MEDNRPEDRLPRYIKLKSEDGEENIYYSTGSREMPADAQLYAEEFLNETEEKKIDGMKKLRESMKKEKLSDIEDFILIAVLRCCKYDLKKSEGKLKKFLKLRKMVVKNIKKIDMKKLEHMIDDGFSDCLPFTDKEGRPIYYFRPNMNLEFYDYDEMAVYGLACLFTIFTYPLPTTKGVVAIIDCKSQSPTIFISILNAYRQYLGIERTVPFRIGRIDIVNENVVVHYVFAILRPFLPAKIVSRVAFHGSDMSSLHKFYHPDILPEELGGTMGPANTKFFKEEKLSTFRKLRSEKDI